MSHGVRRCGKIYIAVRARLCYNNGDYDNFAVIMRRFDINGGFVVMAKGMRGGFGRPNGRSNNAGGMNFGGGNMQQMLRQAQKMQADMEKEQAEINEAEFEGTSGGGAVKVVMKGDKTVLSVELKPEVVDPDDVEMLQDLIVAAFNDGASKVDEMTEERMGKYSAALNM